MHEKMGVIGLDRVFVHMLQAVVIEESKARNAALN